MAYAVNAFCCPSNSSLRNPRLSICFDTAMVASSTTLVVLIVLANVGVPLGCLKGVGTIGYFAIAFATIPLTIILADLFVVYMRKTPIPSPPVPRAYTKTTATPEEVASEVRQKLLTICRSYSPVSARSLNERVLPNLQGCLSGINRRYGTHLAAICSRHFEGSESYRYTIKILDKSVTTIGEPSPVLRELNNYLYTGHGIVSNVGIQGRAQKKRLPTCFEKGGHLMYPQLEISLTDIRKIVDEIDAEGYLHKLKLNSPKMLCWNEDSEERSRRTV